MDELKRKLKVYKVLTIILWVLYIASMIVSCFTSRNTNAALIIFVIFLVLWLIKRFWFTISRLHTIDKLFKIYDNDCDPLRYLEKAGSIESELKSSLNLNTIDLLGRVGLAYIDVGSYQDAHRIVSTLYQALKDVRIDSCARALICSWLYQICLAFNNESAARIYCGWMGQYMHTIKNKKQKEIIQECHCLYAEEQRLKEAQEHVALIRFYEEVLLMSTLLPANIRIRIKTKYKEALCYRALGEHSAEKMCLQFVVERGGGFKVVRDAKARLEELGLESGEGIENEHTHVHKCLQGYV